MGDFYLEIGHAVRYRDELPRQRPDVEIAWHPFDTSPRTHRPLSLRDAPRQSGNCAKLLDEPVSRVFQADGVMPRPRPCFSLARLRSSRRSLPPLLWLWPLPPLDSRPRSNFLPLPKPFIYSTLAPWRGLQLSGFHMCSYDPYCQGNLLQHYLTA